MGLTRCTVNMSRVSEAVQIAGLGSCTQLRAFKNSESLNTYLQIPSSEAVNNLLRLYFIQDLSNKSDLIKKYKPLHPSPYHY